MKRPDHDVSGAAILTIAGDEYGA